jgi:hypothetical protein
VRQRPSNWQATTSTSTSFNFEFKLAAAACRQFEIEVEVEVVAVQFAAPNAGVFGAAPHQQNHPAQKKKNE